MIQVYSCRSAAAYRVEQPERYLLAWIVSDIASLGKFDSECGWPSFTRPVAPQSVAERSDNSHGMIRTEVRSSHGDGHLGHLFGSHRGTSYRSAIFYTSDEQKRTVEETIADVDASGIWPGKAVTEIEPAGPFWEAEREHKNYLKRYPNSYTCHYIRPNWRLPHRAA